MINWLIIPLNRRLVGFGTTRDVEMISPALTNGTWRLQPLARPFGVNWDMSFKHATAPRSFKNTAFIGLLNRNVTTKIYRLGKNRMLFGGIATYLLPRVAGDTGSERRGHPKTS